MARPSALYVALAEQASGELYAPQGEQRQDTVVWLRRIEAEYDNLRAALQWAVDEGEVDHGLRLAMALKPYWYLQGSYSEARQWLHALLAAPPRESRREQELLRVRVLHAAGEVAAWQGDTAQWTRRLEQSLALARELGDAAGSAAALRSLGTTAYGQGDARQARALLDESLRHYQAVDDTYGAALASVTLAALAREEGDDSWATALLDTSLAHIRERGTAWQIADVLWHAADLARVRGDAAKARELLEESLGRFQAVHDPWAIACILNVLGLLAYQEGDAPRATRLLGESLSRFRALGHVPGIWGCLIGLVGVARAQGQLERAARLAGAAEALSNAIGSELAPHLFPSDRRAYDKDLVAVRAAMSEPAFAAALAQGLAMPLEQAIAYALERDS